MFLYNFIILTALQCWFLFHKSLFLKKRSKNIIILYFNNKKNWTYIAPSHVSKSTLSYDSLIVQLTKKKQKKSTLIKLSNDINGLITNV